VICPLKLCYSLRYFWSLVIKMLLVLSFLVSKVTLGERLRAKKIDAKWRQECQVFLLLLVSLWTKVRNQSFVFLEKAVLSIHYNTSPS
jgi:hypothetical protein